MEMLGMKVLIVEDSAPVRQSLRKLLAELPHVQIVGEAETVIGAMEMLESSKPEVVILDLALKDGSGFDVLKKTQAQLPHPRVIILSNYALPPIRKRARQEGVQFFFDKSTEFEKVIDVLKDGHCNL